MGAGAAAALAANSLPLVGAGSGGPAARRGLTFDRSRSSKSLALGGGPLAIAPAGPVTGLPRLFSLVRPVRSCRGLSGISSLLAKGSPAAPFDCATAPHCGATTTKTQAAMRSFSTIRDTDPPALALKEPRSETNAINPKGERKRRH